MSNRKIAVIGLGYVGLPLAVEFGKIRRTVGFDINKNRMGTIRGSIKKFTWINRDDTVLISLREFDNNRCDIIHKYNNDEVLRLQKLNEIPNNIMHIEDSQKNIDYNIEFTSI